MSQQRDQFLGSAVTQLPMRVWLASIFVGFVAISHPVVVAAEAPEPELPRPGSVLVLELIGEAVSIAGEQRRPLKVDERVRVGSTIITERMSLVTLILSNGATLRLGSESELELEEFGQATIPGSPKFTDLKEEPTVSRTRLHLERGDVAVNLKPLNASRGSSFTLSMLAGTLRSTGGAFHARVRISDLGLGVCTLELEKGAAEFEPREGKYAPLPVGRQVAFAIEVDRLTGTPKISEMPKAPAPKTD